MLMTERTYPVTVEEWAQEWQDSTPPEAATTANIVVGELLKRVEELSTLLGGERSRRREAEENLNRLRVGIRIATEKGMRERAQAARSAIDAVRVACEELQNALGEAWR
jgi:hypothetical protein